MNWRIMFHVMWVFTFLYGLLSVPHATFAATNLALGKPYTMSRPPSYPLTAPATDTSSLTDGTYTTGHFWIEKTTIGWWPVYNVEVVIDLESVATIESISFNTVRGATSGVKYPAQIQAFVGQDLDHLLYVGDIADDPNNLPGDYLVHKFTLNNIKAKGRYVMLYVIAADNLGVFCDEIEVLQGDVDLGQTGSLNLDSARQLITQLKWPTIELKQLRAFLASYGVSNLAPDLPTIMETETSASEEVNSSLLAVRADVLRNRFPGQSVLVEPCDLWTSYSPFSLVTGAPPAELNLAAPISGHDQKALLVTNLTTSTLNLTSSLTAAPNESAELSVFNAPFIRSAALEYVPDPLVKENAFSLQPGESRIVVVSILGLKPNSWQGSLRLESGESIVTVPLNYKVSNVQMPDQMTLNAVNWGYLVFNLTRDRKVEAAKDLFAHHTQVVVVPPSQLLGGNLTRLATDQDFNNLETYLKYHIGGTKLLLGFGLGAANHKTVVGIYPFLSTEWQEEFKKWYQNVIQTAARVGFTESQIFLYPYDEMGGEQVTDFIRFAAWAKNAIPTVKFYATFGEATLQSSEWQKTLPYLDIVQSFDESMLKDVNSYNHQAWIYDCAGMSRSLSPYRYYRLKSWIAFQKGYTGIGFWSYADIGDSDMTAWKELQRDFAVIYDGPGTSIISSRRWEAWSMGIEDYELLTKYAKLAGDEAAKLLVLYVLENQQDTNRADIARQQMLSALSNIQNDSPRIINIFNN